MMCIVLRWPIKTQHSAPYKYTSQAYTDTHTSIGKRQKKNREREKKKVLDEHELKNEIDIKIV